MINENEYEENNESNENESHDENRKKLSVSFGKNVNQDNSEEEYLDINASNIEEIKNNLDKNNGAENNNEDNDSEDDGAINIEQLEEVGFFNGESKELSEGSEKEEFGEFEDENEDEDEDEILEISEEEIIISENDEDDIEYCEAAEETSEDTSEDASEETSEETSEDTSEDASEDDNGDNSEMNEIEEAMLETIKAEEVDPEIGHNEIQLTDDELNTLEEEQIRSDEYHAEYVKTSSNYIDIKSEYSKNDIITDELAKIGKTRKKHANTLALGSRSTKINTIVLPFIKALGYNIFNPDKVQADYKDNDKAADFLIKSDSDKSIYIKYVEDVNHPLNNNKSLFACLDKDNKESIAILMDIDKLQIFNKDEDINMLFDMDIYDKSIKMFESISNSHYDYSEILKYASYELSNEQIIEALKLELENPSKLFLKAVRKRFNDDVNESGLNKKKLKAFTSPLAEKIEMKAKKEIIKSAKPSKEKADKDEASEDELNLLKQIQDICSDYAEADTISLRFGKHYTAVLFENNNRKSIARLFLKSPKKQYIVTFANDKENKYAIEDLNIDMAKEDILQRIKNLILQ